MESLRGGGEDGCLVIVEQLGDGVALKACHLCCAVDDFVGDAHHGVEVADVCADATTQEFCG